MYPFFTLPGTGITISTYDVALALAVIVCVAIGPAWTQPLEGIDARTTRRVLLWLGLVTFAGGRAHFVAANWHLFAGQPLAALKVWSGGFHAPGAIGFLALGAVPILRWQKAPVGKVLDGLVPTMGLGIATARLGCLLHGCCFGAVCNWAWCITFPEGSYVQLLHRQEGLVSAVAERSAAVHPLQLYFAGSGLLITLVALWLHSSRGRRSR